MVHSAVRREVTKRAANTVTPTLQLFLNETPEWKQYTISWKHLITTLRPVDTIPGLEGFEFFATVNLSIGRLQSKYRSKSTKEEIFFAKNDANFHGCYRFIAVCVSGEKQFILAERIRPVSPDENFALLQQLVDDMERPANTYAFNVLTHFRRYDGVLHGRPSGELEKIHMDRIKGVGGYIETKNSAIYVQINGSCVHH
ncbi:hypothetical protein CAEBREN_15321 [Caenorhabditis brenneri]|uniref:Uncharacterized protein n=1 Tax=Caenorhabditis brenneri TaxID=135651 RepID=G0PN14_CAEBE|nr:hypothetical protein CAEBREN_15321 [Caenorhabditis brenneri]